MSQLISRCTRCRLCNSDDIELVLNLNPTPIADDYIGEGRLGEIQKLYPLNLFLCHQCSYVGISDVIDSEILYKNYLYRSSTSIDLLEHFKKLSETIISKLNPPPGSLAIDIGSNDGMFLNFLKSKKLNVLGIDPAVDIARNASENGIETLPEFFNIEFAHELKKKRGQASIITANNVMANIDNLSDMIQGIYELLSTNGVFIFETGYLFDLFNNLVFDYIYHEHLSYYSVQALDEFFKLHKMELFHVERIQTKGGSLRGFVQRVDGNKPLSSSVKDFISAEKSAKINQPVFYHQLRRKLNKLKTELHYLIADLTSQSKIIAGYGASHSVTTFIYQFELNHFINFLLDDNPKKHNTYSPGSHIPVFPSEVLYEKKPDFIIIFAWRFYDSIIQKHQKFLDQGGHFIIPLPEIIII